MTALPTGTVTFLFTDIEGSTRLLEQLRAKYAEVLADQRKIMREAFGRWNGQEIDTQGDAFFVAFTRAGDALRAAIDAQRALAAWQWPGKVEVRVRMGIHSGEPLVAATGYVGMDVHRAARIAAAGHGGQILLSGTARDLVEDELPQRVELRDLGSHRLKDLRGETHLYQVAGDGLLADFPALKTTAANEPPPSPGDAPYRGLQAFEEDDAPLFFGREETVDELVELVRSARFLALIGASGSGKSSILRAGVIHALRAQRPAWRIHLLTPTAHPLEALASAVAADASPAKLAVLVDDLRRDPRSLALLLRRSPAKVRLLIAIDQLEEVFTLCRDEADRAAFLANLAYASALDEQPARSPPESDRATLVVTMRADFYAFLAPYPLIRAAAASSQAYVGAMSPDELRRALEEPARHGDWEFVPGLVDLLLRDVGDEPGALPLLSHAMLETWRRRRGTTMTLRSYAESGGVKGAIARTADRVYGQELSDEQRAIARNIFVRLTELGEGTQDTRRRVRLVELLPSDPAAAEATRVVVGTLADARLITVSQETAEVAHEALIREWPTLREWLRADREGLRLHRRLTEATREWELSGHDDAIVYRGGRLAQARDWASANAGSLNDLERRFLDVSIAIAEHEEAEREARRQRELQVAEELAAAESRRAEDAARSAGRLRRRAILLGAALMVAGVLAGIAVILAGQSSQSAADARANAKLADQRAAEAHANSLISESQRLGAEANTILLRGEDAELAALLALQGLHARYTPQADAALQRAARLYYGEQLFDPGRSNLQFGGTPETRDVTSAVVTRDGKTLVTASSAAILFWDLATGNPTATIRTVGATSLSLSKDGAVLLSSSGGAYRLPDRAPLVSGCTFHDRVLIDSAPTFRALSPDGKTTALALSNGGIILQPVDACKGRRLRIEARVFSDPRVLDDPFPEEGSRLAFSPDGTRLAGVTGAAVTVWDVARGRSLATFGSQIGDFRSLTFSPDGRRILTANGDGTARLFDARSGRLLETLTGHRNALTDARFSPDGRRVITGSLDLTARLWDVATGRELQRYAGHAWAVLAVAFSPDGRSVFTASADGTARRWLTEPPPESNTYQTGTADVSALAFSGDSRLLASGTGDRAQVRDLKDQRLLLDVAHQRSAHVALSPDGHSLVIASAAGSSLWDVQTGHELRSFGTQSQSPRCDVAEYLDARSRERAVLLGAAAFLPKGDQVLANAADCGLGLWDPRSGRNLRTFVEGSPLAAVSADGSTVAYERFNDCFEAVVVDLRSGRTQARSGDADWCLIDLALAPDGTRLVLTDQGSFVVHVIDVATGRRIELSGHTAFVKEVRVSADGRLVLTAAGGADGTARLWDMRTGAQVRLFPGHADLPVAGVALSPDGNLVAIGGSDGTIIVASLKLEDLEAAVCHRVLRDLTADERTLYGVDGTAATCP